VRTCITGCMRTAFRIRRACGNGSREPAAGAGEGGSSGRVEESGEVAPLLLGHLRRNRVTSRMVGTDGCAPGRVTDSAATAEANRAAARRSCPCIKATARPPLKA